MLPAEIVPDALEELKKMREEASQEEDLYKDLPESEQDQEAVNLDEE